MRGTDIRNMVLLDATGKTPNGNGGGLGSAVWERSTVLAAELLPTNNRQAASVSAARQ